MTSRRWMLGLGIVVFLTCLAAFFVALSDASASCSMEDCGGGCTNHDYCLFDCHCDFDLGECVPF